MEAPTVMGLGVIATSFLVPVCHIEISYRDVVLLLAGKYKGTAAGLLPYFQLSQ